MFMGTTGPKRPVRHAGVDIPDMITENGSINEPAAIPGEHGQVYVVRAIARLLENVEFAESSRIPDSYSAIEGPSRNQVAAGGPYTACDVVGMPFERGDLTRTFSKRCTKKLWA